MSDMTKAQRAIKLREIELEIVALEGERPWGPPRRQAFARAQAVLSPLYNMNPYSWILRRASASPWSSKATKSMAAARRGSYEGSSSASSHLKPSPNAENLQSVPPILDGVARSRRPVMDWALA